MSDPRERPKGGGAESLVEQMAVRLKRLKRLFPLSLDRKWDCELIGPRAKGGLGHHAIDWEGQDGKDIKFLLNNLPKLLRALPTTPQEQEEG